MLLRKAKFLHNPGKSTKDLQLDGLAVAQQSAGHYGESYVTIAVTTGDQKSVSNGSMEDGLNFRLLIHKDYLMPWKTLTGIEKGSRN